MDTIAAKNNRVSKGEYPLGSGFPIGASSIPVGTRFSVGKSSVLYLCEGDGGGAGSLVRLSGDISTKRKAGSLRKAQAASLLPSVEQRYIKAPPQRPFPLSMKIDLPKWEIESTLFLRLFSSLACPTLQQA